MKFCPTCSQPYPRAMRFCLEDGALLSLEDPYHLVNRTLVDRYRIEALAGIGGMGAVYSAHHLGLDCRVAFKILQPNLALGDQQVLRLFENEARTMIRIGHENVVRVLDAGRTGEGIAYIAMEWLEGHTLEDELDGALSFAHTAALLRQIAAALEAAHASRIVHRDLKPSNVMLVKRSDGREQVKVLDFGISNALSGNATAQGSVPGGTPHYGSPEQFKPGAPVDERADLYALGVMLFQMLAGELPFQGATAIEMIRLHRTAAPPSLCQLRPDVPAAVEELVQQLLAKDPAARPAHASDLPARFERALGASKLLDATARGSSKPASTTSELEASDQPTVIAASPLEQEMPEHWQTRIEQARRRGRTGDILVLADEAPNWMLQLAAHRAAGQALLKMGQFAFALEQYEQALRLNPADLESRREKGVLLNRLKRHDEARRWVQDLLKDYPTGARAWGRLGRVEKDAWIATWCKEGRSVAEMRQEAAAHIDLLQAALLTYRKGSYQDPGYHYPAINALTLSSLLADLTGQDELGDERAALIGGVRWAVHCALRKNPSDYWAQATCAELELLTSGDEAQVAAAYQAAAALAEDNWFALDSSRQQLGLLRDLGFRPTVVAAALQALTSALDQIPAPPDRAQQRRIFLFSGHMIDHPDRPEPRFPPDKTVVAAAAILAKLDELSAQPGDLALCGGACGGDLLFAEAALARGLDLQLHLPFDETTFLANSVNFAGEVWRQQYFQVSRHARTRCLFMPAELGPPPDEVDPYRRNNRWLLYTALAHGPEQVRFICLWGGQGGDGPGGTRDMVEAVRQLDGQVHILDTTKLW